MLAYHLSGGNLLGPSGWTKETSITNSAHQVVKNIRILTYQGLMTMADILQMTT